VARVPRLPWVRRGVNPTRRSQPTGNPILSEAKDPAVRPGRRAFTLLELLVTLALIAILAGLVLSAGRRAGEASRSARARAELAALAAALENYQRIYGDYPRTNNSAQLLQSLLGRRGPLNTAMTGRSLIETARFTTVGALDPLVDTAAVVADPWGQPYRYAYRSQSPWSNSSYVLYSIGPDGRDSGTLLLGGYPDPMPVENLDNIYAN